MQENQFQRFENLLEEFKQYIERVQGELKKFNVASTEVDVLEFEGKQYRRVYRKAQPGDVVVFERTNKPEWVTVGKPYKAEEIEGELMFVDDDGDHCFVYGGYITSHNFEDVIVYEPIQEITLNQLRAEIIEKAKEVVDKFVSHKVKGFKFRFSDVDRFTQLIIYNKDGSIKNVLTTRCHPNDVFNEWIGKAILVRKFYGQDASEFENAVQPTEIVIGMKVNINSILGQKNNETILGFENDGILVNRFYGYRLDGRTWLSKNSVEKIIDDTNAIYDEVN